MRVGLLRAGFYLHGCASLKEKRSRLSGLRDRFGKKTSLAVCESKHADELRRGEWTFVASASSDVVVQQALADVERYLSTGLDAEVVSMQREWLV